MLVGEAYVAAFFEIDPTVTVEQRAAKLRDLGFDEIASSANTAHEVRVAQADAYFPCRVDDIKLSLMTGVAKSNYVKITKNLLTNIPQAVLDELARVASWQEVFADRRMLIIERRDDYADPDSLTHTEYVLLGYTEKDDTEAHLIARWSENFVPLGGLKLLKSNLEAYNSEVQQQASLRTVITDYESYTAWRRMRRYKRLTSPMFTYAFLLALIAGYIAFACGLPSWSWFVIAGVIGFAPMIPLAIRHDELSNTVRRTAKNVRAISKREYTQARTALQKGATR